MAYKMGKGKLRIHRMMKAETGESMTTKIRRARIGDAAECGRVAYEAFTTLAGHHNFPPDFPSVDVATGVVSMLVANPGFYGVVAELDNRVVGSNFLDERSSIAGLGPISVDPRIQNRGVGRQLMLAALDRATKRKAAGVRLVQAGYNNQSLCLYTKLGFRTREPLSLMQGSPIKVEFSGYRVRPGEKGDIETCNELCREVHGFDRDLEVRQAIGDGAAMLVEHQGKVTGYATAIGFFAHAVARTNQDLKALIGAAPEFTGPGFLLPTRNHELFTWTLNVGLKLTYQMTLMTIGLYNEPTGVYLPTILY